MKRTIEDLEKALVFERAVVVPDLKAQIADLRQEIEELKDANSMKLLRLKQEEMVRENWRRIAEDLRSQADEH